MSKQLKTTHPSSLPVKNDITDNDYLISSSPTLKRIKVKDITKGVEQRASALESETKNLTSQLETMTSKVEFNSNNKLLDKEFKLKKTPKGGEITLPNDFYKIDFKLYRDVDGKIKHTLDKDFIKSFDLLYYVDSINGDDSNNGTSEVTAFRTVEKAFNLLVDDETYRNVKIVVCNDVLRSEFNGNGSNIKLIKNKNLILTTKDNKQFNVIEGESSKRGSAAGGVPLTWTLVGGTTYQTSRSNVYGVVDLDDGGYIKGTHKLFTQVDTIELCKNTIKSFYKNGNTLYVNSGKIITDEINVLLLSETNGLEFQNSTVLLENLDFYCLSGLYIKGDVNSKIICSRLMKNFTATSPLSENNGFAIRNFKETYMLDCVNYNATADGFNYHFYGVTHPEIRNYFVYEYNCISFDCGLRLVTKNNNATTCHEGANILRVNSVGFNTRGAVCSDVDSCYSIFIDSNMSGSVTDDWTNSSYNMFGEGAAQRGKCYLINSGGVSQRGINGDEYVDFYFESYFEGLDHIHPAIRDGITIL